MPRLLAPLLLLLCPLFVQAEDVIRVYNWNDYIAPEALKDFEKASGVRVEYHTYSTAEELKQALRSGEKIDVAVPSHNDLPQLIKDKLIQPLDFTRLPNRSHLDPQLMSKLAAVDPDNRHAVPYLWGAVGLAVNQPQAEKALGGPVPDSWSLLFDPQYSARLKSCGLSLLDAPDETFSVLMNYQGRNFARSAPTQIRRAGQVLEALRPNLRYIDSERYIQDLNDGKLCVAMAWVGDALHAARAGQPVHFVVPQEGSVLFIDNLVVPSSAQHPDLALRFIDFMLQPKVAAQVTAATLYPNANVDAAAFLDAELRQQPGLYPDQETKRRLFALETAPEKTAPVLKETWDKLLADH
ncbi:MULTISPECIES: polyamine ABC transporter substrate-binding protein [unclassified Pseudomonas]|uniref:polyamine ABC transporter substrate-binding protein n=1 Tax=unclassified Pseudomonas TaxID=196821 RepID=UPI0002A35117|nr:MULTISPECIES: polyamine ABC transporter substrate-binding protein [unclassified Pseudomonas]MBB1608612.1 spermidine/putrescine ABC transporter substrate-binding protein [Pseudomonas sp. UMC76]MBB1637303.1 spermidine/putrescine ABC transporter substrate-binding protein [Pseudomonas sp. UME83]NTX91201.1 polyamine ABC transporter substrate-binding protein [Pseudomonas sp. UMA643]NTY19628.1 polyamine ABC transporter substrate-binding protein [Pseudomonas sp. UMC3103]NTY24358.1 polyamine ABC tra